VENIRVEPINYSHLSTYQKIMSFKINIEIVFFREVQIWYIGRYGYGASALVEELHMSKKANN